MKKSVLNRVSLWECLGVLAILGTLTAALVPVVARARVAASESSMSQWKSQVTALAMYAADYDQAPGLRQKLRTVASGVSLTTNAGCLVEDARFETAFNSLGDTVGCKDNATGRIWSVSAQATTGSSYTYTGATGYCANLTTGGTSAGSWQIPTKDELFTVATHGAGSHFIQPPHASFNPPIQCALTRWTRTKAGNKFHWVILGDPEDSADGVLNGVECPAQVGTADKRTPMDVICVLKPDTVIP